MHGITPFQMAGGEDVLTRHYRFILVSDLDWTMVKGPPDLVLLTAALARYRMYEVAW